MRPRYALLAACLAAAPVAHAQFVERSAEPTQVRVNKPQDATSKIISIRHLQSGKVWTPDGGVHTTRAAQVVAPPFSSKVRFRNLRTSAEYL